MAKITGPSGNQPIQPIAGQPTSPTGHAPKMHGPTLKDLKEFMIKKMGKEKGTKQFNKMIASMGMAMVQQVQKSAERAKQAMKDMNKDKK